ncbi:MAG: hypothetical protein RMY36_027285 [Nostoc sp. SerVER01]
MAFVSAIAVLISSWLDYTNSINDCNTSLSEDAIHRVSTNGLFVAFFFNKLKILATQKQALGA